MPTHWEIAVPINMIAVTGCGYPHRCDALGKQKRTDMVKISDCEMISFSEVSWRFARGCFSLMMRLYCQFCSSIR